MAEVGRQPWIIEGVLPTAMAVSNLGVGTVLFTLCVFIAIYTVMFIIEMKLMHRAIVKGPTMTSDPDPHGMTAAAPAPALASGKHEQ